MTLGGLFDTIGKEKKIKELEAKTNEESFWQDISKATEINQELGTLKKEIENFYKIKENIVDNLELMNIIDESEQENLVNEIDSIEKKLQELEIKTLLNGEYDKCNCYLEIHPGAGGTESCDWASMLARMYERFCDILKYQCEIMESSPGEEAGLKSITLYINGMYAYGYLKKESGVHRLVRISPFDAGRRRHTSFASVLVTPEYNTDINIEIKESDLKIDVYHSSGAGGQSVNTSNSAVRITHIPTGTVVTCQNERSQARNKEIALKMLKNKLYEIELQEMETKKNDMKGSIANINFGSQIRSYVLEPYKLIKDNRSGFEISNAQKFLDGDILPMLEANLKMK